MVVIMQAVFMLLQLIKYAILARAILSFFPLSWDNPLLKLLYQVTEPVLSPIRRLLERSAMGSSMMLDFSPIIAFLLIGLLENILF